MDKDKKKYIPDKEELERESNYDIKVENDQQAKPGRVDFPEVEDETALGGFKADVAQQAGRFSDQVHMDSPAAEAGSIGRDALKNTVEAANKKLKEKMQNKDKE